MKLLDGKTALVTGGNRGIGRAIALKLAQEGANVAFTDLQYDDNSKSLEEELKKSGVKGKMYTSDASKLNQTEEVVKKITEDFGTIHVLVNNAGITRDNLAIRMSEAEWDSVLNINLKGAFLCSQAAAKVMMKKRFGRIVNIASVSGILGTAGQANYASSKAGVMALTKAFARELGARNITVNAVAPGYIATEMTEKLPENVKEAVSIHI